MVNVNRCFIELGWTCPLYLNKSRAVITARRKCSNSNRLGPVGGAWWGHQPVQNPTEKPQKGPKNSQQSGPQNSISSARLLLLLQGRIEEFPTWFDSSTCCFSQDFVAWIYQMKWNEMKWNKEGQVRSAQLPTETEISISVNWVELLPVVINWTLCESKRNVE